MKNKINSWKLKTIFSCFITDNQNLARRLLNSKCEKMTVIDWRLDLKNNSRFQIKSWHQEKCRFLFSNHVFPFTKKNTKKLSKSLRMHQIALRNQKISGGQTPRPPLVAQPYGRAARRWHAFGRRTKQPILKKDFFPSIFNFTTVFKS